MDEFLRELSELTKKHGIEIASESHEIYLIDIKTQEYLETGVSLVFVNGKYEVRH